MALDINHQTDQISSSTGVVKFGDTGGVVVATGNNTLQKPTTVGNNGLIRYNTTSNKLEAVVNGAYVDLISSADLGSIAYLPLAGGTMLGSIALTQGTVSSPSLTFAGDLNTGIFSSSSDSMSFVTNGIERLSVSSSGTISIGTMITSGGLLRVGGPYIVFGEDTLAATTVICTGNDGGELQLKYGTGFGAKIKSYGTNGALQMYDSTNSSWQNVIRWNKVNAAINFIDVFSSTTGNAPTIGAAGTDSDVGLKFQTKGTGRYYFTTGSNTHLIIKDTTSAVNYFELTGNAAGSAPIISVAGADSSIGMAFRTVGSGSLFHFTTTAASLNAAIRIERTGTNASLVDITAGSSIISLSSGGSYGFAFNTASSSCQFKINHTASSVNYITVSGGATGIAAVLQVQSSLDSNADLKLRGLGNGTTTIGNDAFNNAFNFYAPGSAVNGLNFVSAIATAYPYIQAQGSDTNIGVAYITKGTGFHDFTTSSNRQFVITHTASSVNWVGVSGSISGSAVTMYAQGSDTNVGISLVPKGTAYVYAPTPPTDDNSTKVATTAFVTSAVSSSTPMNCRLLRVNNSSITLWPWNGNYITINGIARKLVSSFPTLTSSGLVNGTKYYIYAYWNGSAIVLEASTTAYAMYDPFGYEVKSGDITRTLVGMVYYTGSAFSDNHTQRYVRTRYNDTGLYSAQSFGGTGWWVHANNMNEISFANRVNILLWGWETIEASYTGTWYGTDNSLHCGIGLDIANDTWAPGYVQFEVQGLDEDVNNVPVHTQRLISPITEGVHYLTVMARCNVNTMGFDGANQFIVKTRRVNPS